MTRDTAYGAPHGAPLDDNWLTLLAPAPRRTRPNAMQVLHALGLIAAASVAGAVDAAGQPRAGDTQSIVELRQYTLHPGQRDTLIELFETQFIETQEQAGVRVLAQFRDLDNPDRFVWLRSFADMPSRKSALETFYGGSAWKTHRSAANQTMIDSDNVLLLRPADATSHFDLGDGTRPALDAIATDARLIVATIHYLREPATPAVITLVRERQESRRADAGARMLARFVTEPADNTFPALPVRSGETVLVTFAAFGDENAHRRFDAAQSTDAAARDAAMALQPYLARPSETLRLQPTRRSLLR